MLIVDALAVVKAGGAKCCGVFKPIAHVHAPVDSFSARISVVTYRSVYVIVRVRNFPHYVTGSI